MEVKPITVYVYPRTLDGLLTVFGVHEANSVLDKALQTVFEKSLHEYITPLSDYSNCWRVNFKPSQSNYLIWSKLSKYDMPCVMKAFNRVLDKMLADYQYSLIEPIYKD